MLEIPLNADVNCSDGYAGKITHVIFDAQRVVTHVVVNNAKDRQAQDRLVPIGRIAESSRNAVRLDCSLDEFANMDPFSATRLLGATYNEYTTQITDDTTPQAPDMPLPTTTTYRTVVDEAIPEGQRAVSYGAKVAATDGIVGTVGELIVDPDSGQITHFTLQAGHLWGKHEVTLPLSAIRYAEQETVHLKLDKQAIKSLPSVPRNTKSGKHGKPASFELIARVFDAPEKAAKSLEFIKDIQRQQRGSFKIRDSALLVMDADGKMTVTESGDLSPERGTVMGAVAGGLLGALAGPVGIIVGAAAGAGVGRVSTRWIDLGLPDEFLDRLREYLKPNSSALVLLVEHHYVEPLAKSLAGLEGTVIHYSLTDMAVEQILKEQEGQTKV